MRISRRHDGADFLWQLFGGRAGHDGAQHGQEDNLRHPCSYDDAAQNPPGEDCPTRGIRNGHNRLRAPGLGALGVSPPSSVRNAINGKASRVSITGLSDRATPDKCVVTPSPFQERSDCMKPARARHSPRCRGVRARPWNGHIVSC